jgi:hypothetical protein
MLADALLADAVREGWLTAPLVVAEGAPPRLPVATWEELARELEADRDEA